MQLACPNCMAKNRVPDERLREAPSCGKCGTLLMATVPTQLDDTNFSRFIEGTDLPVIEQHSTRAAITGRAPNLGAGQAQIAAQHIRQASGGQIGGQAPLDAIDLYDHRLGGRHDGRFNRTIHG